MAVTHAHNNNNVSDSTTDRKWKIIIAGGGTGGHIFPALAIANALRRMAPLTDILFVGARGKMEMEKVPQAGFPIKGLDIAGFNRSSLIKNIGLPLKLLKSFWQVRSIFKSFKPDAVIGVGGYSSFPVLRYAQAKGIASFIHESNSFAGKSNILLGKKATCVFVAHAGMNRFFPQDKIVVTGNPIRPAIAAMHEIRKQDAIQFFGLQPGKKTVLAVGGSLGAKSINEALLQGLPQLDKEGLQLIWQSGKTEAMRWQEGAKEYKNVCVRDFIIQMEMAYAAADVVVSRAGAMAVAELCVVKKPVVFVPYPFAAEDHQTANAQALANENAALLVKDSEAKENLVASIISLANDEKQQEQLRNNMAAFAATDADKKIAEKILKTISEIHNE